MSKRTDVVTKEINAQKYSNLKPWLKRRFPLSLKHFQPLDEAIFHNGQHVWIGLDVCVLLHEVDKVEAQGLQESWELIENYIDQALVIAQYDRDEVDSVDLDHEEAEWIKEDLGVPPSACYPLYFITVQSPDEERIVYVGKTASSHSRFRGGHSAALRLHDPKYSAYSKKVYFGLVMFYHDDNYLPLEWIHPYRLANSILDSIESQLIFGIKPELNQRRKNTDCSKYDFTLAIENHTDKPSVLDTIVLFPNI